MIIPENNTSLYKNNPIATDFTTLTKQIPNRDSQENTREVKSDSKASEQLPNDIKMQTIVEDNEQFSYILSLLKRDFDSSSVANSENGDDEEDGASCTWDNLETSTTCKHKKRKANNPTDEMLLRLSVREMNEYLKVIPKEEHDMLKNRRRLLKNRTYAEKCRNKRILSHQISTEENKILKRKLEEVTNERDRYKKKYDAVSARIKQARLEMQSSTHNNKITFF